MARADSLTWIDPDSQKTYVLEIGPGRPERVAVSDAEEAIHVVPFSAGRSLAALGNEEISGLVREARELKGKARWADEGGAVPEQRPKRKAPN